MTLEYEAKEHGPDAYIVPISGHAPSKGISDGRFQSSGLRRTQSDLERNRVQVIA